MLAKTTQYFHTIKHLKYRQLHYRLWYRVYRPKQRMINTPVLRRRHVDFVVPIEKLNPFSGQTEQITTFLNISTDKPLSDLWHASEFEKLWLYQLHYFEYIHHVDEAVLLDWVAKNTFGSGVGWEPYPTSVRLVNWIKHFICYDQCNITLLHSAAEQADYLSKKIEYHILANHLFANAKALLFAGLYFQGPLPGRWYSKAVKILLRELDEQVLSDGAHFELSPMYHAIMLEDVCDMLNLLRAYGVDEHDTLITKLKNVLPKMLSWLNMMSHPDGQISFFNDTTLGVSPTLTALSEYASRLGISAVDVQPAGHASGYFRLNHRIATLIADAGEIGPQYQPGHAHADTLSFELSLQDQRCIVNTGISCYGLSDERIRQRGSAAHSTVVVDDANSSDVWHGFRVGRRARILSRQFDPENRSLTATSEYRGVTHQRHWHLSNHALEINDIIQAAGHHDLKSFFHCHPDISIKIISNKKVELSLSSTPIAYIESDHNIVLINTTYHPGFHLSQPCVSVGISARMRDQHVLTTRIFWVDSV